MSDFIAGGALATAFLFGIIVAILSTKVAQLERDVHALKNKVYGRNDIRVEDIPT